MADKNVLVCEHCGNKKQARSSWHARVQRYCSQSCRARAYHGSDDRAAKFWAKVDKTPGHGPWGDCWPWTGFLNDGGYGRLRFGPKGKKMLTNRVAYELTYGPLPDGMCACHRCDFRPCCNPAHLFPGTKAENNEDKMAKGRMVVLRGSEIGTSKLTEDQVRAIRSDPRTQTAIARSYGISQTTVWSIKSGRRWSHVKEE